MEKGYSIASNGYMLVRVGKDHHLADVRGYAYEHRVVAEQKIGRRIKPREQVHHINGDKLDNRPENLIVTASNRHHKAHHRKSGKRRRWPDEPNRETECLCGCGAKFPKFDDFGRPRRFVSGHNPVPSPTIDAVMKVLSEYGRAGRQEIASRSGKGLGAIASALSKMKAVGLVVNPRYGVWRLPE